MIMVTLQADIYPDDSFDWHFFFKNMDDAMPFVKILLRHGHEPSIRSVTKEEAARFKDFPREEKQ